MKKLAIFVTALMMAFSLCACACDNTAPATDPSTDNTTMPTNTMTIPVPETNIPDPSVDDTMPGGITGSTDATDNHTRSGLNNNMMG